MSPKRASLVVKIVIIVVVAIALLVVAALVIPGFLDFNKYKPRLAEAVHDATGRRLRIDGEISLSLLETRIQK